MEQDASAVALIPEKLPHFKNYKDLYKKESQDDQPWFYVFGKKKYI